jgi:hypothetical protein
MLLLGRAWSAWLLQRFIGVGDHTNTMTKVNLETIARARNKLSAKETRMSSVREVKNQAAPQPISYKLKQTDKYLMRKAVKSVADAKRKSRYQGSQGGMFAFGSESSKSSTTSKFEAGKPTNSPRRLDASDLRKMADVLSRKVA